MSYDTGEEQTRTRKHKEHPKQNTTTIDNKHKIYEVSKNTSPSDKDYCH